VSAAGARLSSSEVVWPLTVDEARCGFCEYRSLCGRGELAGVSDGSMYVVNIAGGGGVFLGLVDVEELGF
jgi:hypothetical protein